MTPELKTIYIPCKVEDELPEIGKNVFTFNTMIKYKVKNPPKDDGENISINCRVKEIPNKCEQWYDENNFVTLYSKVNTWLKPQEVFVFTPEQLNEYTANIIKQTLETATEKAELKSNLGNLTSINVVTSDFKRLIADIDKQSIKNTFEESYEKFKI